MSLRIMFNLTGNNHLASKNLIWLCALLLPTLLFAAGKASNDKPAEDSKNYPVTISADQLVSQSKAGQSEYRGNVQLNRNKLELQGSQLKLIHPNDKLQTATTTGNPATFKDYLPKKQQWVNGEAKQILFDQEKDTVTLIDNASMIMDNGNRIKADKIVIHNKDETFEASGSKQNGRVKMTLQPDN